MNDLVEFLRARLDEDEQVARAALGHQAFDGTGIVGMGRHHAMTVPAHVARFIARHDPARLLAEVEAKRRIVEEHAPEEVKHIVPQDDSIRTDLQCSVCVEVREVEDSQMAAHPCNTLRLLALPYAGYPDYDESWKP